MMAIVLIIEKFILKEVNFQGPSRANCVPSMLWSGESVVEATHFVHAATIDRLQ